MPTPLLKTAHWFPTAPVPNVQFVEGNASGPVVSSNPSIPGVGNWLYTVKERKIAKNKT